MLTGSRGPLTVVNPHVAAPWPIRDDKSTNQQDASSISLSLSLSLSVDLHKYELVLVSSAAKGKREYWVDASPREAVQTYAFRPTVE